MGTTELRQRLTLVGGPPAAGKTTIGQRIAHELGVPFVGRDAIKEMLFDELGWSDRAWSQRLGGASWKLLFYVAELLLQSGQSFVLESNFNPQHDLARLQAWQAQYGITIVQVQCHAEPDTLYARFHARTAAGERHPGHVDQLMSRDQFVAEFLQRFIGPMALDGPVIPVDTTDLDAIEYERILQQIVETAQGV